MARGVGRLAWCAVFAMATMPAASRADAACRIAVDAGHDPGHPGAISARGIPEHTFNEALAADVQQALAHAGIAAFLVAASGEPLGLAGRAERAVASGATLLVSLHHDSVQPRYLSRWTVDGRDLAFSDAFRGFSLFVSGRNISFRESVEVATTIGDELLRAGLSPTLHHAEPIPGEGRPLLDAARGVYRYDDLLLLAHAAIPGVLIEAAVIVNREDERAAASPERRRAIAHAVAAAAMQHCDARRRRADPHRAAPGAPSRATMP